MDNTKGRIVDNNQFVIIDINQSFRAKTSNSIELFCLRNQTTINGIVASRRIIGFCLPLNVYQKEFKKTPPASMIIRTAIFPDYQQSVEQFITRYKFLIRPIMVVPQNENEFQKMLNSEPKKLNNTVHSDGFCIRNEYEKNDGKERWSSPYVKMRHKFQLHCNPHLIPMRFPDGTECYLLLELAEHCQYHYESCKEPAFGHYYFRELQRPRKCKWNRKKPKMPVTEENHGTTPSPSSSTDTRPSNTSTRVSMDGSNDSSNAGDIVASLAPSVSLERRLTYAEAAKKPKKVMVKKTTPAAPTTPPSAPTTPPSAVLPRGNIADNIEQPQFTTPQSRCIFVKLRSGDPPSTPSIPLERRPTYAEAAKKPKKVVQKAASSPFSTTPSSSSG